MCKFNLRNRFDDSDKTLSRSSYRREAKNSRSDRLTLRFTQRGHKRYARRSAIKKGFSSGLFVERQRLCLHKQAAEFGQVAALCGQQKHYDKSEF